MLSKNSKHFFLLIIVIPLFLFVDLPAARRIVHDFDTRIIFPEAERIYITSRRTALSEKEIKLAAQYHERSQYLLSISNYQAAEEYALKAIFIDNDSPEFYETLAASSRARDLWPEYEKYIKTAFYLDMTNIIRLSAVIDVYCSNEKFSWAWKACEYAEKLSGDGFYSALKKGQVLEAMEKPKEALVYYQTAGRFRHYLDSWYLSARCRFKISDYSGAEKDLKKFLQLARTMKEKGENFFSVLTGQKDVLDEAETLLTEIHLQKMTAAGEKAAQDGSKRQLARVLDIMQNRNPGRSETEYLLGRFDLLSADPGSALLRFEKAVIINKYFIPPYLSSAQIYIEQKEYVKAFAALKNAERLEPYNERLSLVYMRLFSEQYSPLMKKKFCRRLLKLYNNREASVALAQVLFEEGSYLQAFRHIRNFSKIPDYQHIKKMHDLQNGFRLLLSARPLESYAYFTSLSDSPVDHLIVSGRVLSLLKDKNYDKALEILGEYFIKAPRPASYVKEILADLIYDLEKQIRRYEKVPFICSRFLAQRSRIEKILTQAGIIYGDFSNQYLIEIGMLPEIAGKPWKISRQCLLDKIYFLQVSEGPDSEKEFYIKKLLTLSGEKREARLLAVLYEKQLDRALEQENIQEAETIFKMLSALSADYFNRSDFSFDLMYAEHKINFFRTRSALRNLLLERNPQSAENLIRESVSLYFDENDVYTSIIDYLEQREKFHTAAHLARKALALFPGEGHYFYSLSRNYLYLKNYFNAVRYIKRAIRLEPKTEYYIHYARIMTGMGKNSEAVQILKAGLNLTEHPAPLFRELGRIYSAQNDFHNAHLNFNNALTHNPADPALLHNLGALYLKKGNFRTAADFFRRTLFLSPDNFTTKFMLSKCLFYLGECEEASEILFKCPQENPYVQYALGRIYEKKIEMEKLEDFQKNRNFAMLYYFNTLERSEWRSRIFAMAHDRLAVLLNKYLIRQISQLPSGLSGRGVVSEYTVKTALLPARLPLLHIIELPGNKIRNIRLDSPVSSEISVINNYCLFSTQSGTLYICDYLKDQIIYTGRFAGRISRKPVFIADNIMATAEDTGRITIFKDGKKMTVLETGTALSTDMISIAGELLVFGTEDGLLNACDIYSGKTVWERKLHAPARGKIEIIDKKLFFGSDDGRLYSLQAQTGTADFIINNYSPPVSCLAKYNNSLYAGCLNGEIKVIDASGGLFWKYRGNAAYSLPPVFSGGGLYLAPEDGTIVRLDNRSGREEFIIPVDIKAAGLLYMYAKNLMIVYTADGYCYHIFIEPEQSAAFTPLIKKYFSLQNQ